MKAKVVTTFKDSISGKVYRVGETFPLDNVEQERIELLSKPHPSTNKIYLFVDGQKTPPEDTKANQQEVAEKQVTDEQRQTLSDDDTQKGETNEGVTQPIEEAKPKTSRKKQKAVSSNEGE